MHIAICDDEKACRDTIHNYIELYKPLFMEIIIEHFSCGEELINSYQNGKKFDILFLDIQMNNIDGVDTAKLIRDTDKNAIIIFTTGFIQFVSETFRIGAFQFLIKPIKEEDFKKDFERAINHYKSFHQKYVVKFKEQETILEIGEILYIEAYNRHLFIYTVNGTFECVGKLTDEEKKLSQFHFVRCHQGYLVNMSCIKLISKDHIILKQGQKLPVSKYLRTNVKDSFNLFLAGCIV